MGSTKGVRNNDHQANVKQDEGKGVSLPLSWDDELGSELLLWAVTRIVVGYHIMLAAGR